MIIKLNGKWARLFRLNWPMLIEMVDVPAPELSDLCWKALVLITRQDFGKVKKK